MAEQKETFGQKLAKLLLSFDVATPTPVAPIEQKFLDLPTADGTALKIAGETLAQGAGVTMPDGTPAPDGDYALQDGTAITVGGGKITAITAKAPQPPAEMTADQIKAITQKFATGTPDDRVANLEIVARALMEYSFGWQMREAQEKATRDAAIQAYQSNLAFQKEETAKLKTELESYKVKFNAQTESMKTLVGIVQEIADEPKAPPVEVKKNLFGMESKSNIAKFDQFAESLKDLKITAQA